MKKTFLQKAIWFLLFGIGVSLIYSDPADESTTWLTDLIISKALGVLALAVAFNLDAIISTIKSA